MNRINVKEVFIQLRNGLAFCFSWIVLCTAVICIASGRESISADLLLKLFALCFWAVFCFIFCFKNLLIRRRGFIFRLTLFCGLFIPAEILMFFSMGIFKRSGTAAEWCIFAAIILCMYVTCVLIDWIVCRKQGEEYTRRLLAYNERRANEQQRGNTGDGDKEGRDQ